MHFLASLAGWKSFQTWLTIAGIPLSAATAVYTAYLFAQAKGRDMWQNPLLPPHLFFQAVLLGAAVLLLMIVFFRGMMAPDGIIDSVRPEIVELSWILAIATLIHLLMVWGEVSLTHPTSHSRLAVWEMVKGRYKAEFWTGVILSFFGGLLPLLSVLLGMEFGIAGAPLALIGTSTTTGAMYTFQNTLATSPPGHWRNSTPGYRRFRISRDRSAIIVDEWGPYDWRSPKLWPVDSGRGASIRLRVLGPAGSWRVVGRRGIATLSVDRGQVGDTVTVTPSAANDWALTLEYRGTAVVSPRGARTAAGRPYRFSYGCFDPLGGWRLSVFPWTDAEDPRTHPDAFAALLRGAPALSFDRSRLDMMWYRPMIAGVPAAKWAAAATTAFVLDSGRYTLRTVSDDGVRVWLDGKAVIDDWIAHESRIDNTPIATGRHVLRVEYYQVDGWTELRVDVLRGRQRSVGSPGPH